MRFAAIIDYGLGNLFSVKHACEAAGLPAEITHEPARILDAAAVVLPGVGAFPDAMAGLRDRGLIDVLHAVVADGVPVVGICLGMQLMLSESDEFGVCAGLGFIDGVVRRLDPGDGPARVKVPHVGWSEIHGAHPDVRPSDFLAGIPLPTQMYFVHSYAVHPADADVVVTRTRYGANEFCSSFQRGRLFGCQFHPERSGPEGLRLYANLERITRA